MPAAGENFAHFTVKILNFTLLILFKIKIAGAFLWAFYYFYGHFKNNLGKCPVKCRKYDFHVC